MEWQREETGGEERGRKPCAAAGVGAMGAMKVGGGTEDEGGGEADDFGGREDEEEGTSLEEAEGGGEDEDTA